MAIVPHDHGHCGKSFCSAIRVTLRKKSSGGTGRLWCKLVVVREVAMLKAIKGSGEVTLCGGSIMVQNSGYR